MELQEDLILELQGLNIDTDRAWLSKILPFLRSQIFLAAMTYISLTNIALGLQLV
jgi:hypothetical protein